MEFQRIVWKIRRASYSSATRLFYAPVVEACGSYKLIPQDFKEGMAYWGGV